MPIGAAFEELLVAAQAGAGWAFARLYEDLAPSVVGYLRMQGARDADDVASETFLAVFRNLASFQGGEHQFRSWVFTIAHRRLQDERRYWSRRPATTELARGIDAPDENDGPEEGVLARLRHEELLALIEGLDGGQRDVLLLRIVAGLTVEETAVAIGRKPGAVKQLQRRGLLKVKDQMSRRGVTL